MRCLLTNTEERPQSHRASPFMISDEKGRVDSIEHTKTQIDLCRANHVPLCKKEVVVLTSVHWLPQLTITSPGMLSIIFI